jgi:hypothetical protein
MPLTTKSVTTRADKLIGAWKQFAAAKTINGHTVAAYETLAKATRDADAALTAAEAAVTAARNTLAASVAALNTASNEVVEGVRGDKTLGGRNGSLYEAMGYVRKDEQASGLTRKKAVVPAKKV